jgi:hypothetical protein
VPIARRAIAGKPVSSVGAGVLMACLADSISVAEVEALALGMAAWRDEQGTVGDTTAVFRDSAFENDVAKSNLAAILEQHGISRCGACDERVSDLPGGRWQDPAFVMLENEELWLSQKQLTELFGKAKTTISEHIKHIFEDGELREDSVVRFFRTTAADGKTYEVAHYNLDMVLALGYRVRSQAGVRFRQWASAQLKEYLVKGFVLDDERLKNPGQGRDYFDELTRRLQDIRTSERVSIRRSPTSTRPASTTTRRRPSRRSFCHGAEQGALRDPRPHGGGADQATCGQQPAQHGADQLERCPHSQERCRCCQELPDRGRAASPEQPGRAIPGVRRRSGGAAHCDDHEGLDHQAGGLPDAERPGNPARAGQVSAELAKNHAEKEFSKFRVIDDARIESDFDRMVKSLPAPRKGKQ